MPIKELKEALKGLINDNSTPEEIEKITKISLLAEDVEKEESEMLEKYDDLRKKYIESVKNTAFPVDKNEGDQTEEHDLEFFLNEEAKKSKKGK